MQRFHFDACTAIPSEMKYLYKNLKTTRPRGVGSPQAYWISSAKELGLVDSDCGIRYKPTTKHSPTYTQYAPSSPMQVSSVSSVSSSCSSNNGCSSPSKAATTRQEPSSPIILQSSSSSFLPLSPESQSTAQSLPHQHSEGSSTFGMSNRDSEANMLLALRNTRTDFNGRKSQ